MRRFYEGNGRRSMKLLCGLDEMMTPARRPGRVASAHEKGHAHYPWPLGLLLPAGKISKA
jgi:hypothetical protein